MSRSRSIRDLVELILGYALIVGIIWTPEHWQRFLSPIALVATLAVVLAREKSRDELGIGKRGFVRSLWILPAAIALAALSVFIAEKVGTPHPLYKGDLKHIGGYVRWTIYQQFAESGADGGNAGVGDCFMRTVPAVRQSVGAGAGAGITRTLLCSVRAGCAASSSACGIGIFALHGSASALTLRIAFMKSI
ncbi:MAG: hypothetical protein WAL56_03380 [Candidatus Sulfotelmatobacter sp.]